MRNDDMGLWITREARPRLDALEHESALDGLGLVAEIIEPLLCEAWEEGYKLAELRSEHLVNENADLARELNDASNLLASSQGQGVDDALIDAIFEASAHCGIYAPSWRATIAALLTTQQGQGDAKKGCKSCAANPNPYCGECGPPYWDGWSLQPNPQPDGLREEIERDLIRKAQPENWNDRPSEIAEELESAYMLGYREAVENGLSDIQDQHNHADAAYNHAEVFHTRLVAAQEALEAYPAVVTEIINGYGIIVNEDQVRPYLAEKLAQHIDRAALAQADREAGS